MVEDTIRGRHDGASVLTWRLDAPTADPTLPLVLALHGRGMSADGFARRLRELSEFPLRLLTPTAPLPIADRNGTSWYDYDGDQGRFRTELLRCESLLLDLVRSVEAARRLAPSRRWVVGFSQGGYCGSWLALRNPEFFRGMAIVGARVKTELLAAEMARAAALGFEALLCHGRRDVAVKPVAAERSRAGLEEAGVPVQLQWFDASHSLRREQVEAIATWLEALGG